MQSLLASRLHATAALRSPGRPAVPANRLPGRRRVVSGMGGTASRAGTAKGAVLFDPLLCRTPTSSRGRKRGVFRRAQRAVVTRATRTGLLDCASVAAVDATGLETRHVSLYLRVRRGIAQTPAHRRRSWPKLTAVVRLRAHHATSRIATARDDSPNLDAQPHDSLSRPLRGFQQSNKGS